MVDMAWDIWSSLGDFGLVISSHLMSTKEDMENDFGKIPVLQNTLRTVNGRKYLEPHVIYS